MKYHLEKSGIAWNQNILVSDLKKKFDFSVLHRGNCIVGYVWLSNGKKIYLKSIILDKNLQGKGIGTLLLDRLNLYAGKRPIYTFVQLSNKKSQEFFEFNGYKKIGTKK